MTNDLLLASLFLLIQEIIELRGFRFETYPFPCHRCKANIDRLKELRETYLWLLEKYLGGKHYGKNE